MSYEITDLKRKVKIIQILFFNALAVLCSYTKTVLASLALADTGAGQLLYFSTCVAVLNKRMYLGCGFYFCEPTTEQSWLHSTENVS
jgi:hypothetical protein